jgi:hypothetical protein
MGMMFQKRYRNERMNERGWKSRNSKQVKLYDVMAGDTKENSYPSFSAEYLVLKGSDADRPTSYDVRGKVVVPASGPVGKGICGNSFGTEGNASKSSSVNSLPPGETVELVFVEVLEDRDCQEMGR